MAVQFRPQLCRFLQDILCLECMTPSIYKSSKTWMPTDKHVAGYGGDILAQGLEACRQTLDDDSLLLNSMHCYFVRPRLLDTSVQYDVDVLRDGRAFSSRSVRAVQSGKVISSLQASFHNEAGELTSDVLRWHPSIPKVATPENLETLAQSLERTTEMSLQKGSRKTCLTYFTNICNDLTVDLKLVDAENTLIAGEGATKVDQVWFRMKEDLGKIVFDLIYLQKLLIATHLSCVLHKKSQDGLGQIAHSTTRRFCETK